MKTEKINFSIKLRPEFWDKPPTAQVYLDNEIKFNGVIDKPTVISFNSIMTFGTHQLKIERGNKTNDQCVDDKDQKLHLDEVSIDDINIRNIVWHYSWYEPKYPQPWALLQQKQGITLETKVIGETTFGHNGAWYLNFTSPFYNHLIDWMRGDINDTVI